MIAPLRRRIKKSVTVDRDSVSPDLIDATLDLLRGSLEASAEFHGAVINWNTFRVTSRSLRKREQRFTAKARVL